MGGTDRFPGGEPDAARPSAGPFDDLLHIGSGTDRPAMIGDEFFECLYQIGGATRRRSGQPASSIAKPMTLAICAE